MVRMVLVLFFFGPISGTMRWLRYRLVGVHRCASLGHSDSAAGRSACDWSSGPHADIGFVAGGPIMFLYMPIDDRTSLSVSSVMAVGFGIGSPMEGRPDLIRSVSSLRDSAEVSPPGSRPMA